ncbi:MAG: fasciclin domain-containing protein, partial [Bacteroidota bacterium]|nr:fasciclin domain-containing protein [Bacteroidota bacterium]
LTATLDAEGTYTVFAPNNAAFEAYLGGTAVADVPVEDLTQILLNHVLAVEARASSLTTGYVNNLATYADTDANLSMYINVDSDVVTINGGSELEGGANVTATDLEFSNGIVHTVDAVIALPTVATFAVADPTFTQLETALTTDASFSFVNTLTSAGTFTVFAPTNDAFADLLAELEISGFGDLDTSVLAAALSLHVVNGANVRAEDLTTGTVTTLGGAIEVDASNATLTDANGRVSTIVVTDVQASNGVVHAIDTVLLPGL